MLTVNKDLRKKKKKNNVKKQKQKILGEKN